VLWRENQESRHISEVIVKEQISLLAVIQLKDNLLAGLKREIQEGPSKIHEREQKVQSLVETVDNEKAKLDEIKALQRQCENDIEDGLEKIRKSKARLINIKSNKEYQAVLKEIADTEGSNRQKEDMILAYMEQLEALHDELREREDALSKARKSYEEEKAIVERKVTAAKAEVAEQERQRHDMAVAVDPSMLNIYDRLKTRLGGQALASVENATCSACHMSIPPQMYNELQRMDSLTFCPNCDRLLYWKNGNGTGEKGMSE
jgi:predicted  nucleic acid-binding Zn-ribbon protein